MSWRMEGTYVLGGGETRERTSTMQRGCSTADDGKTSSSEVVCTSVTQTKAPGSFLHFPSRTHF